MDENALLKQMGLTETNASELNTIFSAEINDFLKQTMYTNAPHVARARPDKAHDPSCDATKQTEDMHNF